MLNIDSAKLTGTPGPSGWSQVHEFRPQEPEKLEARGHLFAVVGVSQTKEASGPDLRFGEPHGSEKGLRPGGGVDSAAAGRELLARFHEEYFGKLETTGFNALKIAVETVTKEFSETWGDIEIAAVCVLGDVVYSVAAGGAQVSIARGGALAKILTSGAGQVSSASGYPKKDDFLVFGTKKFFEAVSLAELKSGLETGDASSAAESFAPKIHARADSGNLGAIILKFREKEAAASETQKESLGASSVAPTKVRMSEFLLKAKGFGRKILNILPERKIYVRRDATDEISPDSRKTTLSVGAIILVLLIVSIGFGIRQRGIREVRGKYAERLTQAEHSYDEALSLVELSPERARELFLESETLAKTLEKEGVKDKRLTTLLEKIASSQSSVLGEYHLEPELFLDLSLLTSGFNGDDLAESGGNLFILDKNERRLVRVAIDTKKTETVAGPDDITSAEKVTGYEDRAFVLEDSGVFEVGKTKGKVLEDTWEGDVLPYVFGANFYILEKSVGVIWRYAGDGTTFGTKQNWFGAGIKPNFLDAVSMAIDGSIWVLNSNGRILKFSQGSPQAFSAQGVSPALTFATAIYTNEENQDVYILDKAGKRVVVLQKDGKYVAQYVADKIGEATDLAVSEAEGKIILLAGPKLYSILLKHL